MTTRNFAPVGVGYHPDYVSGTVWNRTGATLAVGELVMLDMLAADAGFGSNATAALYADTVPGGDGFPLAQILTPTTAGIGALNAGSPGAIFCVVDDILSGAGADDTQVHVCFKGYVKVKMASTVGAQGTAPGEYGKVIVGANGVRTATATYTVGNKAVGRLLEENTTANALSLCLFNGVEGFGIEAAS